METLSVWSWDASFTKAMPLRLRFKLVICLAFFLWCFWPSLSLSQTNDTNIPSPVTPMSPNASSLAMFTDYPVSHYTGVPNITVPLFEIDVDGFKLPIKLAYHASGIQVSQEASWVGLGWSLNLGGSISRSIKGVDDFLEYADPWTVEGYYMDQEFDNVKNNHRYYQGTWGQARLLYDTEPDIFHYSFPGGAGKFVIDKSRGVVLMDKNTNVKIELVSDPDIDGIWTKKLCFRLTTTDGAQYYYKQRENTKSYSLSQFLNRNSTDPDRVLDGGLGPNPPFEYTSTWQLEKITTVNKRVISFSYALEAYESPTQESVTKSTTTFSNNGGSCAPPSASVSYQSSKTRHEALRLTSIIWDQGRIELSASAREDTRGWDANLPPKKLDAFSVYDQANNLIKQAHFGYSYFNADKTGQYAYVFKRLRLDNVVLDNDQNNRYLFGYIAGELLAKNSNNKDYWGYHNGKVYGQDYYVGLSVANVVYFGANKSADVNFMKAGTLNQIVYPTGGGTTFVYEANTFPKSDFNSIIPENNKSSEKIVEVYNDYSNYQAYVDVPLTDTFQFTLTQPNRIAIKKIIDQTACPSFDNTFSYAHPGYPIGILRKVSPTGKTIGSWAMPQVNGQNSYCSYGEYVDGAPVTASDFQPNTLDPGTYVFEALTPPRDAYVRWRINFLPQDQDASVAPDSPVSGGGLRISKIITGNLTKSYTYPTGKLIVAPVLSHGKNFYCPENAMDHASTLQQLSVSSVPLSTIRGGNSVGYDWVDETVGLGKTSYSFYNEREELLDDVYFPYAPTVINYYNGIAQKVEHYRDSTLFKSIDFTYEDRYSNTVNGYIYSTNDAFGILYGYRFNWILKQSEVTKTYFGSNVLEEVATYTYNEDFQPSVFKRLVGGIWKEKRFKYAKDFGSPVYQSMVARHQISAPIETVDLKDGLVIAANKINYAQTQDLNLPQDVYALNTAVPLGESVYQNSYQKIADLQAYNTNGKLLQLNQHGKITSFLWGYNNYFLVAQINGASYADATAVIGLPAIESIALNPSDGTIETNTDALRSSLNNALVKSFTFKPLVGVTGVTNERGAKTSYVYNSVNKLDHVKDHLGNILTSYTYHFRGNSTPYDIVDMGIPTSNEELAWLDSYGSSFSGRFRLTLANNATGVKYTYDIDASMQRIGGFPPGNYNLSIVNLDNVPLSQFSIQISGADFVDGIYQQENLDGGGSRFQIVYVGP